jgi:hypothetical protein
MTTLEKLDLRKELKHLYNPPSRQVVEVDVPAMNFLLIDGKGDPNTALEYKEAVEALYSLSYTLKFASRKALGIDYTIMPLEGLWWMEDMGQRYGDIDFTADKSLWLWTMLIMQPDGITPEMVEAARDDLRRKKAPPALDRVRFERFHEGLAAQVMHLGPYSAEKPTIDRIHAYVAEHGELTGKHHEIYLGDPRRSQPEKLRTIIRQPMLKRG